MNYTGMNRSTAAEIEDVDAVEELLDQYHIDGQYEIDGNSIVFFSTDVTFSVWNRGVDEEQTEQFLEELSAQLADDEELLIRSVGFTGARHIPDAFQYTVAEDGIETEQLTRP